MNKREEKVLFDMIEELKKSSCLYRPSVFWEDLNKAHLEYLSKSGFDNFKQTINLKYFNWGSIGIIVHQLLPILREFTKGNFAPLFKSRLKNAKKFNYLSSFTYKVFIACLFEYISQKDHLKILDNIKESPIGNPILVKYKNKFISQDLCNSVHEFYSIAGFVSLPKQLKVAELGAGYGRVAYVILQALPASSYCIIDIPPALFIAQNYLSKAFPKEKIFKFRLFKSFKEIKKEFESARIKFLLPHQMELLPKKYFDLFINISSLHEMARAQIKNYIKQINRLCKGYFYTKQWRKSRIQDNQFIKRNEYPIPRSWKTIYSRNRHPIQSMFFDALYKIK